MGPPGKRHDTPEQQRLRGCTVLVARPVGRGGPIARRVRALGAEAVHLPTASLRTTDAPSVARGVLARAASAHATIFSSPTAVRFAAAVAPTLDFAALRAIAVGPATARAIARRGGEPILPGRRFDSEGVLALPELARVSGRRIVLVTAPGGRDAIASALAARGARLEHAMVYRRTLPVWREAHREALRTAGRPCLVVVSSVDAVAALARLASPMLLEPLRQDAVVIASSSRVADALARAGWAKVKLARSALAGDLVDALVANAR
jgi:uroporphyrinogen-III synthase